MQMHICVAVPALYPMSSLFELLRRNWNVDSIIRDRFSAITISNKVTATRAVSQPKATTSLNIAPCASNDVLAD